MRDLMDHVAHEMFERKLVSMDFLLATLMAELACQATPAVSAKLWLIGGW